MGAMKCFSASLILLLLPLGAEGENNTNIKAVLQIKMSSYQIEVEEGDGEPCDPLWIGQCDLASGPAFYFCVEEYKDNYDEEGCSYYKSTTGKYPNQNALSFDLDMNGVANPMVVNFPNGWPGRVNFKTLANYPHDKVDFKQYTIEGRPAKEQGKANWTSAVVQGTRSTYPTSMAFSYTLYCMPNHYGQDCGTFCEPQDSDEFGHYICDQDTGEKICRSGWEDPTLLCKVQQTLLPPPAV